MTKLLDRTSTPAYSSKLEMSLALWAIPAHIFDTWGNIACTSQDLHKQYTSFC
jgi:hypothetical protein